MNKFGQTLFGGSAFIRWTLSPFVMVFAVFMPLCVEDWTPARIALMVGMELMCLALLAGLWGPGAIGHWAFRSLAGLVFFAYTAYLLTDMPFRISARRGEASPYTALLGFVVIGLPSLWFALKGRFTFRAEASFEQLAAERQAYEERILRPDWEFYERHLQRPAPAALRELYADRALVTSGDLEYSKAGGINTFNPLDENGLLDTRDQVGSDIVPFATSDCGDPIFLRPGASETDKVCIEYHDDPGNVQVFAGSVAEMLQRLRYASRSR